MAERKHTPGPWSVFYRAETLEVQAKNGKAVIHWMGFDDTAFPHQNVANAHLMAAAPDMLGALIQVRARFQNFNLGPDEAATLRRVDEAIARAKGDT